jgi:hypothetical protein
MNKLGEIVWGNYEYGTEPLHMRKINNTDYFIFSEKFFSSVMKFDGTVKERSTIPYANHDCNLNKKSIICLSRKYKMYKPSLTSKPLKISGFSIMSYDRKSHQIEELWNTFDHGNDLIDFKNKSLYDLKLAYDQAKDQIDWYHANSFLLHDGNKALISLWKSHRIIYIDLDTKKILWSIGPSDLDTYKLNDVDQFHHQHTVSVSGKSKILLYSNELHVSRSMEIDISEKIPRISWSFTPPEKIHSYQHGSAAKLTNGNYLIYGENEKTATREHHFYEVDSNQKIIGNLVIKDANHLPYPNRRDFMMYRAYEIPSLAGERYIGNQIE